MSSERFSFDPEEGREPEDTNNSSNTELVIPTEKLYRLDRNRLNYYMAEKFDKINFSLEEHGLGDNAPDNSGWSKADREMFYSTMGFPIRESDIITDEAELDERIKDLCNRLNLPIPQNKEEAKVVQDIGDSLGLRSDAGDWRGDWKVESFITTDEGTFAICENSQGSTRFIPVEMIDTYKRTYDLIINQKLDSLQKFAEANNI